MHELKQNEKPSEIILFYFWPWTWPDDLGIQLDLDMMKNYLHAKNEISRQMRLK